MSPTSNVESQASVDFIKLRGRTSLVTVSRDDIGNLEAVSAVRADASRAGISLQPSITYSSSQGTDFNAVARQIADAVSAAGNAATVGVYVAGFDEVAGLLADCAVIPSLQDVAFYGSDGVAQNSTINSSAKSSFFAVQADSLPSALIGVPTDKQVQAQQVTLEIGGTTPNGFVLNAYDVVSIMTNAYIANSSFGSGGAGDRTSFVKAADGYSGLTGTIELNAAGDRITALYTMWGVCYVSGLTNWYSVGSWTPSSWTSTSGVASYSGCPAT
jgi:branched-chain amino acid transport system substrate-binding protein